MFLRGRPVHFASRHTGNPSPFSTAKTFWWKHLILNWRLFFFIMCGGGRNTAEMCRIFWLVLRKSKKNMKGFSAVWKQNDCSLCVNMEQEATLSALMGVGVTDHLSPLRWTLWWRRPLTWRWAWRGPEVDGSSSPLRSVTHLMLDSHQS